MVDLDRKMVVGDPPEIPLPDDLAFCAKCQHYLTKEDGAEKTARFPLSTSKKENYEKL